MKIDLGRSISIQLRIHPTLLRFSSIDLPSKNRHGAVRKEFEKVAHCALDHLAHQPLRRPGIPIDSNKQQE
jgi:hypothetical protein